MTNHLSALPRVTEEILNEQDEDSNNIIINNNGPKISFQDPTASEQYDPYYDSDAEAAPFGWGSAAGAGVSKDTLQEGQVIKAGYLMKKGERIKIWKKRWFVLRTSKFAYYKDDKEYELLRILDVRDVHRAAEVPVKHKSAVFVILTPRRTFTVQAKSVAEMQEWLQAINQAKVQSDFMASTSDLESLAGSTLQLGLGFSLPPTSPTTPRQLPVAPAQTSSLQQSAATQHKAMAKQSIADVILARRQPPNTQLSLTDQELHDKREASSTRNKGKNVVRPLSVAIAAGDSAVGSAPHTGASILDRPAPHRAGSRRAAGEGLSLITTGTQAIQIATPSSPRMEHVHAHDPALGSFSSGQSYTGAGGPILSAGPMTPSSPGYNSGGELFWNTGYDQGFSSGDEECADEEEDSSVVVEAGRVATEANAPGSGIVTGEQLESKVVRTGNLLKFGNKYKTWRKRWFVLRGDKLTYYKNHKTDPVSKSKQYCLRIVTAKRSFVCCAPDEDTLLQWLDALHVECDRVALEARQEVASEQAVGTTAGTGAGTDVGLTKVESVEESESPTKPMGRTARIRMSFHSTLPRARSISRSRSKSGDGSVTGAGGLLLPPSAPLPGQGNVPGVVLVHNASPTMTTTTSQIRKVMSLDSGVGPGGRHVGGGDGLQVQSVPAAIEPVA
ncbi:hypothetical protein KI688_006533 [Linnemannia hyalina]|uniref:PH domain-containing protein n=1 Tax=Linnemannia hyalina TaxID=64524 RepID=A0A9P8BNU7_9FUNG|nr:hypothetical protein KI688_006533 [Linnemannia hyalina]